ncbi:uncharacterized protein TNCV_757461 [Trichonephila clavipes]|nr:uncharacterized protein TNCV_757461 [Trichonephila clavipes]
MFAACGVPVSAADKVYPLDPHRDAVSLYSGCTLGKRRAWYLPDDRHTAFFAELRRGWRHVRMKLFFFLMDPMLLCPDKGLVLPILTIDQISEYSRCASVGHSSTDCTLEPKCVNCTQSHPSDSKLCQKWKFEKQIQEIKTNKNISYVEARRLIVPQLTQTYAQATKPSTISAATQTDPNISNIICPPLQCLTPISSKTPLPSTSSSVSTFSTSSSSTQDNLLPSPSGILPTIQSESLL